MKTIGNILWLIFGGLETALGYFAGSLVLAITIIGIPFAIQTFKLGLLCLWPFGATLKDNKSTPGCLTLIMNIVWIIITGWFICLLHLCFGLLLCITIIGIPWGTQHFKMAGMALTPFGKEIHLEI